MKEFEFNDIKITVCEDTGAVYIYLTPEGKDAAFRTEELPIQIKDEYSKKMIMVDFDSVNNPVGVEIL